MGDRVIGTDAELLAATRRDASAFARFYDRYERAVVGYFLRRTRDAELSADLAAEVFAAALAGADRYRPRHDSAAAWLFTIAANTLASSLRRGRVEDRARRRIGICEPVAYSAEELDRLLETERESWAEELLERLPPDQRAAVRARILDERPYGEIARSMSTSELVIRKRVSRGLASLRSELEERG